MAGAAGDGFERQRYPRQEEEEEEEAEEEDVLEGRVDLNGALDASRLAGHMDRWNISSSSQEILEDVGLLEELKDYQDLLAGDEQGFDLDDLQDFECTGEAEPGSPPPEDDGSPEGLGPVSHWQHHGDQRLVIPEDDLDHGSSEDLEKQRGTWDGGSEAEAYPELSYEGQYGSEFSASPEALKDPLALYNCSKSYSFTSDGGEEVLSEHSNLSPSPSRPPPECTRLKMDVFETLSLCDDSQEFPDETELTSASGRSPGSHTLSSPEASTRWSCSPLDRLRQEVLQNLPSIDAETFPESSWAENLDQPVGPVLKMAAAGLARTSQRSPSTPAKPKGRLLNSNGAVEMPPTLRQPGRARGLKADVPRGLPSKFSRQSRSLSPQRRTVQKRAGRFGSRESVQESHLSPVLSDGTRYGRGQLNYPLPDLSKVEPRVRFPRDPQRYHPPRGRTPPARSKDSGKPVIFKSPAEIVREVLLSSGEGSPPKGPAPTVSVIPEELKSPRQATELVHQLQEDYHRLLTKYAEAENTIDRLRLGAKVRLYADPPKPSHGVEMGTVSQPSKVITFSIPQVRAAEVTGRPGPATEAVWNAGHSGLQPTGSSFQASTGAALPRADGFTSAEKPFSGDELTQLLAAQAKKFRVQVESLGELIRTGERTPQDQLKGFARLKEAQDALEQAYLQARDEHRQPQNHQGTLGEFDLNRAVEGEIFQLEMRLEELKEEIESTAWNQPVAQDSSGANITTSLPHFPTVISKLPMGSPTPSLQAPIPAVRTPYPEAPVPKNSHCQVQADVEGSSVSDETEEEGGGLPEPLQQRRLQVEKDFDQLLDHYSSFRSLPEAMSLERLHHSGHNFSPEETDGAAAKDAGTKDGSLQMASKESKAARISSTLKEVQEREPELPAGKPWQVPRKIRTVPSARVEESVPQEPAEKSRPSTAVPGATSRRRQDPLSPHSSMASVAGSAASEHVAQKSFRKTNAAVPEDLRIVSPETDSGFVGSEASRVSPLAQMPKHRSSQLRSCSMLGNPATTEASLRPEPSRELPVAMAASGMDILPRHTAPEGSTQRHSLAKGLPFQSSSPPRWRNSLASEMEPDTDSSAHTDSEVEARRQLATYKAAPDGMRPSPSSSAASPSPPEMRRASLLNSRLERDQAIAALQSEVLQLKQSLEETLHRPYGHPKQSSSPRATRLQMPYQGSARVSTSTSPTGKTRKSTVEPENPTLTIKPEGQTGRLLLPRDGTQQNLPFSESNRSLPMPRKGRHHEASASRTKSSNQPILRGPYTGTTYPILNPELREPTAPSGSTPSSHHQDVKSQLGEGSASCDSPRDSFNLPQRSAQKKAEAPSHLLRNDTRNPKNRTAHGTDHGRTNAPAQSSGAQQKHSSQHQPQQPGLWYLAVPPPASSFGYIPTIPLASYPLSSIIYCPPTAATSTFSPAGLPVSNSKRHQDAEPKTWASWRRPRAAQCCSLTPDDAGSLRDLDWSLSRAVEAAKDMKFTTKRMSRSLTWELNKARSLRGSCLF
ncbi:microtubule organization protein AKNA [Elgaria multicarinata webbii]|uniref:microtubule organization protein AKNA n=1 Tax=Elgaria multicarinata webbii TaxID=159646 RepID=UPI002FCCC9BB